MKRESPDLEKRRNSFVNSFIRILYLEQSNHEELRMLIQKVLFDEPVQFQKIIFDMLIELNYLKKVNSEYLAVSFYAPVLYYCQKFLIGQEMTEETKTDARNAINAHINFFLKQ